MYKSFKHRWLWLWSIIEQVPVVDTGHTIAYSYTETSDSSFCVGYTETICQDRFKQSCQPKLQDKDNEKFS